MIKWFLVAFSMDTESRPTIKFNHKIPNQKKNTKNERKKKKYEILNPLETIVKCLNHC